MDNFLFEKAYIHMLDILNKFTNTSYHYTSASASATSEETTISPKELFTTKKATLMAMIAFLNSCYGAQLAKKKKILSQQTPHKLFTSVG